MGVKRVLWLVLLPVIASACLGGDGGAAPATGVWSPPLNPVLLPDRFDYTVRGVYPPAGGPAPMVGYSDAVSPWAISASSAQEAWIVGSPGTRAWQWNGERWTTTPMPEATGVTELHGVVSIAGSDA